VLERLQTEEFRVTKILTDLNHSNNFYTLTGHYISCLLTLKITTTTATTTAAAAVATTTATTPTTTNTTITNNNNNDNYYP